jgi:hypothetical protein
MLTPGEFLALYAAMTGLCLGAWWAVNSHNKALERAAEHRAQVAEAIADAMILDAVDAAYKDIQLDAEAREYVAWLEAKYEWSS